MISSNLTCESIFADIRRAHPVCATVHLQFGPCRIAVGVSRPEMADGLRDYFKPFLAPEGDPDIEITAHEAPSLELPVVFTDKTPDPGKSKIKEAWVDLRDGRIVRKRLTGMVFVFGDNAHMAVGPCLENMNQVVNFINNRFIQWQLCRGALLGHAAGVMINGKGVALAGFSGAGKSTLSLEIMNRGATFVSNDRLMVAPGKAGLTMHGVAKMPRINPGTALNNPALEKIMSTDERELFSAMSTEDLWNLEYKFDAFIDDCYGPGRFVLSAPMNALVLLNWQRDGRPATAQRVDLSRRRDLLPAFMKSVGLFFQPHAQCRMPEPTEENYIDLLSACAVWEISGGTDFEAATQVCLDICK